MRFLGLTNAKKKRGYLAPEYAITGHLTRKSDVYSFGVLLLEIISGRSAVDFDLELGEHYLVQKVEILTHMFNIIMIVFENGLQTTTLSEVFSVCEYLQAWQAYKDNKLIKVVDNTLNLNFPEEEALRFLMIGLLCVQETAKLRPRMSTVAKMLTNETDIRDVQISQPGQLPDLKNIRLHQKQTSESSSSRGSTVMSLPSTTYF